MKRLSNKKYMWNKILWLVTLLCTIALAVMCGTLLAKAEESEPSCSAWNSTGDDVNISD